MIRVEFIPASKNQNVIGQVFPELLKSGSKGDNIAIVYTMIDYN